MSWSDAIIVAAICLGGGAVAIYLGQQLSAVKQGAPFAISSDLAGRRRDWCTAAVFSALLLLCSNAIIHQLERGAAIGDIVFSLFAIAASAFACGAAFGRLLLRRELRPLKD